MSLLLLNNKYKFSTVGTNYFINVKKYLLINKHTVEEYYRNKIDRVNNNILKDIINDLYRDEADIVDFVFAIIKSATTIKATTKIAPPLRTDSRISTNLFVEEPP